jgi:hypothetical protein
MNLIFNIHNAIAFTAAILLIIWGIPHTIFMRNLLLGLGALFGIYYLLKNLPFKLNLRLLPLGLLYALLIWVVAHFIFFAQDSQQQLVELRSLWFRVSAAMVVATSMGVLIKNPARINNFFIAAFFGMSLAIISIYIFNSMRVATLLHPETFLNLFLFNRSKVTTAFFSTIDISVGCACLCYIIYCAKNSKKSLFGACVTLLLISLSILASVVINSKNGVIMGAILIIILNITLATNLLKREKACKLFVTFFTVLVTSFLLTFVTIFHKEKASPGWSTLFADIEIAVQIDKYQAWRGSSFEGDIGEPYPRNKFGQIVIANTYERFAWFVAGAREIYKHPMGYGLINTPSFGRWLKFDKISSSIGGSAHSGWIDLGLSYGFPGLGLVLASLALTLVTALRGKDKSIGSYLAIWISLAVLGAGFFQEITHQHNFEAMIFFATFSAACIASVNRKKIAI